MKAPITESYLGKILLQSESGRTDMRPVVTDPLAITENPFNTEPLTENSIVTELILIGQGGSQAVIGGTHTQSIIEGRKYIIHGDVITHMITNPRQISLKGDYFPFEKEQTQTLMLTSLLEALLARNRNICTTSIMGHAGQIRVEYFPQGCTKIFLVEIMSEVLSAMTSVKRINSILPLTDLQTMKGTQHLRKL